MRAAAAAIGLLLLGFLAAWGGAQGTTPKTPGSYFSAYASEDGVGAVFSATGDYSGGVTRFQLTAPAGVTYRVYRIIPYIQDGSGFVADEYGNLGTELTNGIEVKHEDADDAELNDLTGGIPIKSNAGWGRACYDAELKSWGQTPSDEMIVVRWTFSNGGQPVVLRPGESLTVLLNDDFSDLTDHTFLVQGHQLQ